MSGTTPNALSAAEPAGAPNSNALATGAPQGPQQSPGPLPVAAAFGHLAQAEMSPEGIVQAISRSNYTAQELGRLAHQKDVTRKDVIRAVADAVGARQITADQGVQFVGQIPEKPDHLRSWLQQIYRGALTGSVALYAHAHGMAGNMPPAPGGPAPMGAQMPGVTPQ